MWHALRRWRSLSGDAKLKIAVIAAGILVLLWTALPFFWMFWVSLMTKPELVEGIVQTIDRPTLDNYLRIFGIAETDALFGGQTRLIGRGFLNSFIVALPTALLAAAGTLSIVPPLLLALFFQRLITRLNIVDPINLREA